MGLLDGAPLDVTHPDSVLLIQRLYQVYVRPTDVESFAVRAGIPPAFLAPGPAATMWQNLVVTASNQHLLRALVSVVRDDPNSAAPDMRALLTRLLNEPVEPVGPAQVVAGVPAAVSDAVFGSALLWDDLPFIDRVDLRANLKMMVGPAGRRALLVMGDPGSGKSYTRQFIHFLTDNGGPRRIRPIDMSIRAGAPIDVRELASSIARTLLDTEPPTFDPLAQAETVVGLFKAWLTNAIDALTEPTWLVFDGFTNKTATSGAIQLVNELALAAAARDLGSVRVVVLGFAGNPAHSPHALCEPLTHPSREDVKAFFGKVGAVLQGTEPADDALEVLVDAFTQAGGSIESRAMAELGPSALAQARAVFGPQP